MAREDLCRRPSRRIGQHQLDLRGCLGHAGELRWIVVDEEDRRRMEVELRGDGAEVVGLGIPVDADGGEIGERDGELRALREEPLHVDAFVSRAESEDEARFLEQQELALQRPVPRPHPDLCRTVFAQHAFVESVV